MYSLSRFYPPHKNCVFKRRVRGRGKRHIRVMRTCAIFMTSRRNVDSAATQGRRSMALTVNWRTWKTNGTKKTPIVVAFAWFSSLFFAFFVHVFTYCISKLPMSGCHCHSRWIILNYQWIAQNAIILGYRSMRNCRSHLCPKQLLSGGVVHYEKGARHYFEGETTFTGSSIRSCNIQRTALVTPVVTLLSWFRFVCRSILFLYSAKVWYNSWQHRL